MTTHQPKLQPEDMESLFDRAWLEPSVKDWADVLGSLSLFEQLPRRDLRRLASRAKVSEFAKGEVVVQGGEPGDSLHVILSGEARILGRPRARAMRAGDYFGEMALIDGGRRSATITAASDLQTIELPRGPFVEILRQEPGIAIAVMEELAARVRRLEERRPAA